MPNIITLENNLYNQLINKTYAHSTLKLHFAQPGYNMCLWGFHNRNWKFPQESSSPNIILSQSMGPFSLLSQALENNTHIKELIFLDHISGALNFISAAAKEDFLNFARSISIDTLNISSLKIPHMNILAEEYCAKLLNQLNENPNIKRVLVPAEFYNVKIINKIIVTNHLKFLDKNGNSFIQIEENNSPSLKKKMIFMRNKLMSFVI